MLRGDLNNLQQLALLTVMDQEDTKQIKKERRDFVMMAIAMHPERTDSLLRLLSDEDEDPNAWATPITEDEDLSGYVPIQQRDELRDLLTDLQSYGAVVFDDED